MPRKNSETLVATIAQLTPAKQDRIEAAIAAIAAEPEPDPPMDGAAVAAAYELMDDQGKDRVTQLVKRVTERMARRNV